MKGKARYFQGLALIALAQPLVAVAHPFHWAGESLGFIAGLLHPFTGADHILTMLMVGLWLAQTGWRLAYCMPFVFVVSMLMGCGLTLIPIEIGYAEQAMYLSILSLGLMLAFGRKFSSLMGGLIVAGVAVFHGYVHAYDIWLDVDVIGYTVGFALATMLLIAAGMVMGSMFHRLATKFSFARSVER